MLIIEGLPILLTPKSVVSYSKRYTASKYHSHFVVEFLRNEHLRMGGALVQYRKDGAPFVTKKDIIREEAPLDKEFLAAFTKRHPEVFADFKEWFSRTSGSIPNRELDDIEPHAVVSYLKRRLQEIEPGRNHAADYHRTSMSILELVFYPDVVSPKKEKEIHQGGSVSTSRWKMRPKRAFSFGSPHHSSDSEFLYLHRMQELLHRCRQSRSWTSLLAASTSTKGQVGLMLCRSVNDMPLLLQRCADGICSATRCPHTHHRRRLGAYARCLPGFGRSAL